MRTGPHDHHLVMSQGVRTGPHDHHLVMSQEETVPVPLGICDQRCTQPLGVVRLAMRRHCLTEPVQSAQYSRFSTAVIA